MSPGRSGKPDEGAEGGGRKGEGQGGGQNLKLKKIEKPQSRKKRQGCSKVVKSARGEGVSLLRLGCIKDLLEANYVEHYVDSVDDVDDVARQASVVLQANVDQLAHLKQIEENMNKFLGDFPDDSTELHLNAEQQESLKCLEALFVEVSDINDIAIEATDNMLNSIENRLRTLDLDSDKLNEEIAKLKREVLKKETGERPEKKASLKQGSRSRDPNKEALPAPATKSVEKKMPPIPTASMIAVIASLGRNPDEEKKVNTEDALQKSQQPKPGCSSQGSTSKKAKDNDKAQASKTKSSLPDSPDKLEVTYCLCEKVSKGKMIQCDNDLCPVEWFHFKCVGLHRKAPKGNWYCPRCRGDDVSDMKPMSIFLKELAEYNKEKEKQD